MGIGGLGDWFGSLGGWVIGRVRRGEGRDECGLEGDLFIVFFGLSGMYVMGYNMYSRYVRKTENSSTLPPPIYNKPSHFHTLPYLLFGAELERKLLPPIFQNLPLNQRVVMMLAFAYQLSIGFSPLRVRVSSRSAQPCKKSF